MKTIYNFSVQDAELKDIPLKDYKDKVLLVVNVALNLKDRPLNLPLAKLVNGVKSGPQVTP